MPGPPHRCRSRYDGGGAWSLAQQHLVLGAAGAAERQRLPRARFPPRRSRRSAEPASTSGTARGELLQIADHEPPSRGEDFFRALSARLSSFVLGLKEERPPCSTPSSATTTKTSSGPGPRRRTTRSWPSSAWCRSSWPRQGKLGPVARLMPTTAATTLRKGSEPPGHRRPLRRDQGAAPGLLRVDCADLDEALDVARDLGAGNPGGAYEIRPLALFRPDRASGDGAPRDRRIGLDRRGARARPGPRRSARCCAISAISTRPRRPSRKPACAR